MKGCAEYACGLINNTEGQISGQVCLCIPEQPPIYAVLFYAFVIIALCIVALIGIQEWSKQERKP